MKNLKFFSILLLPLIFSFILIQGCGGDSSQSIATFPGFTPVSEYTPASGNTPSAGATPAVSATPAAVAMNKTGTAIGYVLSRTDGGPDINNGLATFQLSQSPNLPNYAPVKDAIVSLKSDPYIKAITDANGRFELHNVPYSKIGDLTAVTVVGNTENIVSNSNFVPIEFTVIVNPFASVVNAREAKIHPESGTLYTGQAYQFKVYCRDEQNNLINPDQYKWECSSSIGTIDQNGILQVGNLIGSGTVTVTAGDNEVTIVISVVERPATGTITGQLTYSDGSPGKDVKISVKGLLGEFTPDSDGQYTLSQIPPGKQVVIITYNGQTIWIGEIEVALSANTNLNVSLQFDPVPPSIISLNPPAGVVDTPVVILGSHFGSSQSDSTVTFNGLPVTVKSWSNSTIVAQVPQGFTDGDVSVKVNNVSSNKQKFYLFGFRYIAFISDRTGYLRNHVYLYDIATLSVINLPFIDYNEGGYNEYYVDLSSNGHYLSYTRGLSPANTTLYLYDLINFSPVNFTGLNEWQYDNSLNSDGNYITFHGSQGGNTAIYLYNRSNSSLETVTAINDGFTSPSISSDERYIACSSNRYVGGVNEGYNIYLYDRNISSFIDLSGLNHDVNDDINPSISNNAVYIAFESNRKTGISTVYLYDRSSTSLISLDGIDVPSFSNRNPCISNDGNYIVFDSNRSGTSDIYIYSRKTSSVITLPDLNSNSEDLKPALGD